MKYFPLTTCLSLALCIAALGIASCDLVNVTDNDPPDNLVDSNVVTDAESAEQALRGVYSIWGLRQYNLNYRYEVVPAFLSGYADGLSFYAPLTENQLSELPTEGRVEALWTGLYYIISAANNVISLVGDLDEDVGFEEGRRSEIIAEARFLRAQGHFNILRYYGQFYDLESRYGIVIREQPSDYTTRVKERATVQESYDFILEDLNFAIENGPDFSVTYRASKTAARALKARVLLYMGRYEEAAALAGQIIEGAPRSLESSFADVFNEGRESSEMILMRYTDEQTADNDFKPIFYGFGRATPSEQIKALMGDDPRAAVTYTDTRIIKVNNEATFHPTYFIRLAEMYLIRAEALARSGASVEEARQPLNVIRCRAYSEADPPDASCPEASTAATRDALLEDIFEGIVRELVYEGGHEWNGLIRFGKVEEVKESVTSEDQYILPIPREAERFGNPAAEQNPGYN